MPRDRHARRVLQEVSSPVFSGSHKGTLERSSEDRQVPAVRPRGVCGVHAYLGELKAEDLFYHALKGTSCGGQDKVPQKRARAGRVTEQSPAARP